MHVAMKKDREWAYENWKKLNDSLLNLIAKVKKQDQQVLELESTLVSSQEELGHLFPQLMAANLSTTVLSIMAMGLAWRGSGPSY